MTIDKKRKRAIRASAAASGRTYQAAHNLSRPTVPRLNLTQNPSAAALKQLLAACDDSKGHHIGWVDNEGFVHIDLLPAGAGPLLFEKQHKDEMRFRLQTFVWGNKDVGPDAAADDEHVERLLGHLRRAWESGYTGCFRGFEL